MTGGRIMAMYDLPKATVRLGMFSRAPLALVVYESGRAAVVYEESGVTIELRSTH